MIFQKQGSRSSRDLFSDVRFGGFPINESRLSLCEPLPALIQDFFVPSGGLNGFRGTGEVYLSTKQIQISLTFTFSHDVRNRPATNQELPISGLVDFVVKMRGDGKMPLIKTWKVKSGESTCMYFNGKECK